MKNKYIIQLVFILGIFVNMPNMVSAALKRDSLVMLRVFAYKRNFAATIEKKDLNLYLKYTFKTKKRNPTLFLIPTMYYIAKGNRNFIGETFGKISFKDINVHDINRQLSVGTIPHNGKAMSQLIKFITPNLYGVSIFYNEILSPFCRSNKGFYRYNMTSLGDNKSIISFAPKTSNTQLVTGFAIVESSTGRIISTKFYGEYDMIKFNTDILMDDNSGIGAIVPKRCETDIRFNFLGNKIQSKILAVFDDNHDVDEKKLSNDYDITERLSIMKNFRREPLSNFEQDIYNSFIADKTKLPSATDSISISDSLVITDTDSICVINNSDSINIANINDSTYTESHKMEEQNLGSQGSKSNKTWNTILDNVIGSMGSESKTLSMSLSPLVNPLYISYSNSRGLSYKVRGYSSYYMSANSQLTFNPTLGYNFKLKKLFYNAPVRYTFNKKKDGWIEFLWANGNRISNSGVLDKLKNEKRDTVNFSALNLDYFIDNNMSLSMNYHANGYFNVNCGFVYHQRHSVAPEMMKKLGKQANYRSFAPIFTLTTFPFNRGPQFTFSYERSINGICGSNMRYEKIELDASYTINLGALRKIGLRMGSGFYTDRSTDFFVDFSNFHENYLSGGWDDEWTGSFQLLNSDWYNASNSYIRYNGSYETPMLLVSYLPILGKYVEMERIYFNTLKIEHTRTYCELGYGCTNRYFSIGVFASFLNSQMQDFGCKFSFELFRKW